MYNFNEQVKQGLSFLSELTALNAKTLQAITKQQVKTINESIAIANKNCDSLQLVKGVSEFQNYVGEVQATTGGLAQKQLEEGVTLTQQYCQDLFALGNKGTTVAVKV